MSDTLKQSIYINLLELLQRQLELNATPAVSSLLADACLMLFTKWAPVLTASAATNDEENRIAALNSSIIYMLNERKTDLSPNLLTSLQILLTQTIYSLSQEQLKPDHTSSANRRVMATNWVVPTVGLAMHSLHQFELTLDQECAPIAVSRCAVVALTLFNAVITAAASEYAAWLPLVKNNVIVESLVQLLSILMEKHKNFDVAQAALSTLINISADANTAGLLQSASTFQVLNAAFKSVYEQPIAPDVISKSLRPKASWSNLYQSSYVLATTLLIHQKQFFATHAIEFVKYHAERIRDCFVQLCDSPSMSLLEESTEIMSLLVALTTYKHLWLARDRRLFEDLNSQVARLSISITTFLKRPR